MTDSSDLKVTRRREGDAVIVAPEGEIDLATTELSAASWPRRAPRPRRSCSTCAAWASWTPRGLRMLVEAQREAERPGRRSSSSAARRPSSGCWT